MLMIHSGAKVYYILPISLLPWNCEKYSVVLEHTTLGKCLHICFFYVKWPTLKILYCYWRDLILFLESNYSFPSWTPFFLPTIPQGKKLLYFPTASPAGISQKQYRAAQLAWVGKARGSGGFARSPLPFWSASKVGQTSRCARCLGVHPVPSASWWMLCLCTLPLLSDCWPKKPVFQNDSRRWVTGSFRCAVRKVLPSAFSYHVVIHVHCSWNRVEWLRSYIRQEDCRICRSVVA